MTDPTTLCQLAYDLAEKEAHATKGPWVPGQIHTETGLKAGMWIGGHEWRSENNVEPFNGDSAFIAYTRATAPQIIQALRDAAEEIQQLYEANKTLRSSAYKMQERADRFLKRIDNAYSALEGVKS